MKPTIALALGSGGARGMAHIGVINELTRQGYEIKSVAGSSMGALVGGVYAAGKLEVFAHWLCTLSKRDVFNLVDFTLSAKGIIKADKVFREIHHFVPDCLIEDLPIPFAAVATDFRHKKEVVFTEGSLFEAIRASVSIPLVITPLERNDTLFLDGGVLNPVPVNRVSRLPGDLLIAVNLNGSKNTETNPSENADWHELEKNNSSMLSGFQKKLKRITTPQLHDSPGYFQLINETSGLMLAHIMKLTLQQNPPDLLIEIPKNACGTFDFYKASELIDLGSQQTQLALLSFQKQYDAQKNDPP